MARISKYSDNQKFECFRLFHDNQESVASISDTLDIPRSTVHSFLNDDRLKFQFKDSFNYSARQGNLLGSEPDDTKAEAIYVDPDEEIVDENVRLSKKNQVLMDRNRIERKSFREFARVDAMLSHQTAALLEAIKDRSFNFDTVKHTIPDSKAPIGVIQMSDHHINEVVDDLESNKFDIFIASQRIQKHIAKSIVIFKANGVKKVLVAMTGDLIKNSQFISEITENSMDRASATILAVELYTQAILHINHAGFDVILAGIVGNESRIAEKFDTTNFLASESFDMMILKFLQILFKDKPGIEVVPMHNPLECVVNLNGQNLLLVHGNAHGRLSNNGSIEKGVEVIKARYGALGVKIDYVIMGHIHSAYIGDNFSRSSGLPGSNSYSERTLNLNGKASQNSYLFWPDGSIDGHKIDLQKTAGYAGYDLDTKIAELMILVKNKAKSVGTMNIIASYVV